MQSNLREQTMCMFVWRQGWRFQMCPPAYVQVCIFECVCVFALEIKSISLQLISRHLFCMFFLFHQTPEHLLQQTSSLRLLFLPICVCMCVCAISSLTPHPWPAGCQVTPYLQKSISLTRPTVSRSFYHSLALFLSLHLIGTTPLSLPSFFIITCVCCGTFPLTAPFPISVALWYSVHFSLPSSSDSIFKRSLPPTSHLWLCKMSEEEKGMYERRPNKSNKRRR